MKIISFEAVTEEGVIKIPTQYINSIAPLVQVIIVIEEKAQKPIVEFKAFEVDTKNNSFDRDEAEDMHHQHHIEKSLKIINPFI